MSKIPTEAGGPLPSLGDAESKVAASDFPLVGASVGDIRSVPIEASQIEAIELTGQSLLVSDPERAIKLLSVVLAWRFVEPKDNVTHLHEWSKRVPCA